MVVNLERWFVSPFSTLEPSVSVFCSVSVASLSDGIPPDGLGGFFKGTWRTCIGGDGFPWV